MRTGRARRPVRSPPRGFLSLVLVLGAVPLGFPAAGAFHPSSGPSCTPGSGLVLGVDQVNRTEPSTVSFQLTDPQGPPSWENWSFGDGTVANGSSFLSITHQYALSGTFGVLVRLGQGASIADCTTSVIVVAAPLLVTIHARPSEGPAPLTVQFTAEISGGTSTYISAEWSFGNGQGGSGFNVSYTYASPDEYAAVLIVTDSADQQALGNTSVTVIPATNTDGPPPGPDGGLPGWALGVLAGLGIAAVIGGLGFYRWRTRSTGHRGEPTDDEEPALVTPPTLHGPSSGTSPTAPIERERLPLGPTVGPSEPMLGPTRGTPVEGSVPGPAATAGVAAVGGPSTQTSPERGRLKLSQRVMLHLYRQGHLADGEVAPVGFTQGGMSDQIGVAQSPLSSVLRRLTVAGLVVQDTRHVRGQPRRLRVYRLSPVGESVARDLYLHPPAEEAEGEEADEM